MSKIGPNPRTNKRGLKFWLIRLLVTLATAICIYGLIGQYLHGNSKLSGELTDQQTLEYLLKATAENNTTDFIEILKIHELPKFRKSIPERLTFNQFVNSLKKGEFRKAQNYFFTNQAQRMRLKRLDLNFWRSQSKSKQIQSHPALMEACLEQVRQAYQSIIKLGSNKFDANQYVMDYEQPMMQLMDTQLRTGQALDHLWEIGAGIHSESALADYILKSLDPGIDTRGLDQLLDDYIKADPQNPFIQRAKGLLEWSNGRFDSAEPYLQSAALQLENDSLGAFAWADTRLNLGLPIDVTRILNPTAPNDPNFATQEARRFIFLSALQQRQNQPDQAIESLQEAVRLNPREREAWARLGQLLILTGKKDQSTAASAQAQKLQERETFLRKLCESIRKNDVEDPEYKQQVIDASRNCGFDSAANFWSEILLANTAVPQLPTSNKKGKSDPSVSNASKSGSYANWFTSLFSKKTELSSDQTQPDIYFAARPRLRTSPLNPSSFPWLQSKPNSTLGIPSSSSNSPPIVFEEVSPDKSGLLYDYKSFSHPSPRIADVMGGGVAVIDFDKDGYQDLYFPNGCDFSEIGGINRRGQSKLFRNIQGQRFEDVTGKAGLWGYGYQMGAAVGDFNNDSWPDLFITGYYNSILYQNRGNGSFEDVTIKSGVKSQAWTTAAAFADLDADGDQDLFAVTYVTAPPDQRESCIDNLNELIHCSPGMFQAQPDILWENLGNGQFRDVSIASGIAAAANGRGLGLAVADLDNDGLLDLFVANDASPNFYFQNQGGLKFVEKAAEAGLAVDGSGKPTASMGVVADDLDEDGLIDIFHTNFINEPNTFRKNLGQGLFMDSTSSLGLGSSSLSRTGFGTVAFDANLDGHKDLFITNGHLDNQAHIKTFMKQKPLFYQGFGKSGYRPLPETSFPYLNKSVVGRGMASVDFNNDGLVDLVVVHRDEQLSLLQNKSRTGHSWVGVQLLNELGGPAPVGTKVLFKSSDTKFTQWVVPGTSYLSVNDPRMVFPVDNPAKPGELEIQWPQVGSRKAHRQVVTINQSNQYHRIQRQVQ